MTTADALPGDMPGLRAAALALIAERDRESGDPGQAVTLQPRFPLFGNEVKKRMIR